MRLLHELSIQGSKTNHEPIRGLIEKIERYRIYDGPGIRSAVFFMGCPLNCRWCSNPETWEVKKRIAIYPELCDGCGDCISICPDEALYFVKGKIAVDRKRCTDCGICASVCVREALRVIGKQCTVDEIISELLKDESFYESSHGGVTLTGGEPTVQMDFLEELCKKLKDYYLSIALDTCGYFKFEEFLKVMPYLDYILFDVKAMDVELHRKYTGVDNKLILANLQRIDQMGVSLILRLIIIHELNDSVEETEKKIKLISSLHNVKQVDLLPYHNLGVLKYRSLDLPYPESEGYGRPDEDYLNYLKKRIEAMDVRCTLGGN